MTTTGAKKITRSTIWLLIVVCTPRDLRSAIGGPSYWLRVGSVSRPRWSYRAPYGPGRWDFATSG